MKKILLSLLLLAPLPALAQTVTLAVAPTTATGTATPTLTWSSTGVSACVASGGWSGNKAASGTETVAAITATTTYTLTCAGTTGQATLNWTPPTRRTDGTTLTNLAGYRVYTNTTNTPPATFTAVNNASAVGFTLASLSPGLRYFWLSAVDANGLESAKTSSVNVNVVAASVTATPAVVTITSVPSAPSAVTVTSP